MWQRFPSTLSETDVRVRCWLSDWQRLSNVLTKTDVVTVHCWLSDRGHLMFYLRLTSLSDNQRCIVTSHCWLSDRDYTNVLSLTDVTMPCWLSDKGHFMSYLRVRSLLIFEHKRANTVHFCSAYLPARLNTVLGFLLQVSGTDASSVSLKSRDIKTSILTRSEQSCIFCPT